MAQVLMLLLEADPAADPTWLRIDADGHVLERGTAGGGLPPAPAPGRTALRRLLVVPGAAARTSWVEQPAHSAAQARAVVAALQGGDCAGDTGDLHIAVAAGSDGWMAVVVAASRMREWRARAAAVGFAADAAVPDYLLLPADDALLHLVESGTQCLVRGPRLAFAAELELAQILVTGREVRRHETGEREALLARGALALPLDLLQDAFANTSRTHRRAPWRRTAAMAAALVLSPLLLLASEALRYAWAGAQARAEATALARTVVPDAPADAPAAATGAALAQLQDGDAFARRFGAALAAVSATPGVQVETLRLDGNRLQVRLRHPDAAALDAVVAALATRGIRATVSGSEPQDAGIRSDLDIGSGA